ncbi:MAG: HpcH/HpaI aldolase family protein [Actinomycetota bacterium]
MPTEQLREAWARDEPVLLGWLLLEGPSSAGVVAGAGFDAVVLDLQHGSATIEVAGDVFAAVEVAGAVPLARPRWNDPGEIMRLLDLGARGIVSPMVSTRAEAASLAAACRYPPEGVRSFGPVRGALGSGAEQVRRANEAIVVLAMIETAEGFRNLDEIASMPGIDGLYVGPADLSLGLGLSTLADLDDPELLVALDTIVTAARRHGVVPGVHAPSPERAIRMIELGFRLVCPAVDADTLGSSAAAAVRATRDGLGSAG